MSECKYFTKPKRSRSRSRGRRERSSSRGHKVSRLTIDARGKDPAGGKVGHPLPCRPGLLFPTLLTPYTAPADCGCLPQPAAGRSTTKAGSPKLGLDDLRKKALAAMNKNLQAKR